MISNVSTTNVIDIWNHTNNTENMDVIITLIMENKLLFCIAAFAYKL
jgi:hypothetical protein